MILCNEGHAEVCYEGKDCPACVLQADVDYANKEIETLEMKVSDLETEIKDLQKEG